jgi:hypothetical protein
MSEKSEDTVKSEVEQAVTPDKVQDVDELVNAGEKTAEEVRQIAENPRENNPITRAEDVETEVEHLRRVSQFLDSAIRIPGTNYRFGADSLSGLLPGIGDFLSAVFSVYIVYKAYILGVSISGIIRMSITIVIDTIVGVIPLLGDLFDVGWKANNKNVKLLEEHGTELETNSRGIILALSVVALPILLVVGAVLMIVLSVITGL